MAALAPVDRFEVHVLIDNVTDYLSSVPSFVERVFDYHWRRGMRRLSGNCICCANHGLSCLITAYRGAAAHTLLFDAGPEGNVFAFNVARLGTDLAHVESIVLSHGHWDHCGGMLRALDLIRAANGGAAVAFFAHPRMFGSRAIRQTNGKMRPMQNVPSVAALSAHGAEVINTTRAAEYP